MAGCPWTRTLHRRDAYRNANLRAAAEDVAGFLLEKAAVAEQSKRTQYTDPRR